MHARTEEEFQFLLWTLRDQHLVREDAGGSTLSAAGWKKVEELRKGRDSRTIFVAMAFGDPDGLDLGRAYTEGILPSIRKPRSADGATSRFSELRIDDKPHANKICEEILLEIRRSRAVVADLTYHPQNVYFEAGYAQGKDKPVIWLCHEDHFEKKKNENEEDEGFHAHFDVRQHQCILWKTPADILEHLPKYLEAILTP